MKQAFFCGMRGPSKLQCCESCARWSCMCWVACGSVAGCPKCDAELILACVGTCRTRYTSCDVAQAAHAACTVWHLRVPKQHEFFQLKLCPATSALHHSAHTDIVLSHCLHRDLLSFVTYCTVVQAASAARAALVATGGATGAGCTSCLLMQHSCLLQLRRTSWYELHVRLISPRRCEALTQPHHHLVHIACGSGHIVTFR